MEVWRDAQDLAEQVYRDFFSVKDYSFCDQIKRAVVSISNNIAEGFELRTKKDFAHFLDLSKGSSGEVRSMLYLAEDRSYIEKSSAERLRYEYKDLSQSIGALASKLRSQQ